MMMMPAAMLAAVQFGGYINPWKAAAIVVVLLAWTRLMTWIDKDAKPSHLPRQLINSIMLAGLILGYLLFFLLPGFAAAFCALLGLLVADVATYLIMRAQKVGLSDLTGQARGFFGTLFKKKEAGEAVAKEGQVLIFSKSGAAQPVPAADSPERMPYDAVQQLLGKPLQFGFERLEMTAGEIASVNYVVDGVLYQGDPMDRNKSGAVVQYLKRAGGLDMMERRKPQTGVFRTLFADNRREIQITTFGSTAGESIKLLADPKSRHDLKLEALGLSDDQLASVRNLILNEAGGLVLMAAPPGHGLTTLAYAMIRSHDAFMYHVHTVERAPEVELEGITQNKLPANVPPAEELKQVDWILSQEPDVVAVTLVENPQTAASLSRFAADNRRVYAGLHAINTFDALRLWRKAVGDDKVAVGQLKMIIASRLVRRLCSACKVGYAPDPATLKKLNMDPAAVGKLYLARKEPMRDAKGNVVPCSFCHDLSFMGRFGVYEVFNIDDEVRQAIQAGASDNQIKQLFRKQHGRLLQEMALGHVQVGETSVEEVLRVLRGDSSSHPPGSPQGGASHGGPARGGSPQGSASTGARRQP